MKKYYNSTIKERLLSNMNDTSKYPFLSKEESTQNERFEIYNKLKRLDLVQGYQNKSSSGFENYSIYISNPDSHNDFSIRTSTAADSHLVEKHDFEWFKEILSIKRTIDNSESSKSTWLDNQLKELEHGR